MNTYDVDKIEINKILYGTLKGEVRQDNSYRWSKIQKSFGAKGRPIEEKMATIADTPLSKLASYYLDCLSKDMDSGISEYASSIYGSPEYGQMIELPQLSENVPEIYASADINKVINKVRRDRNRFVMQLGYPILLRKVTARATFYVVEPVLLVYFDTRFIYAYECTTSI